MSDTDTYEGTLRWDGASKQWMLRPHETEDGEQPEDILLFGELPDNVAGLKVTITGAKVESPRGEGLQLHTVKPA